MLPIFIQFTFNVHNRFYTSLTFTGYDNLTFNQVGDTFCKATKEFFDFYLGEMSGRQVEDPDMRFLDFCL